MMSPLLESLIAEAKWRHPTLHGAYADLTGLDDQAVLGRIGLPAARMFKFSAVHRAEGYNEFGGSGGLGGHTEWAELDGQYLAIVGLRLSAEESEYQEDRHITILMHELGHVQDAERGLNIRLADGKLDLRAAELYAHHYACQHMLSKGLARAMALYLTEGFRTLMRCQSLAHRDATIDFSRCSDFRRYRAFSQPYYDAYVAALRSLDAEPPA